MLGIVSGGSTARACGGLGDPCEIPLGSYHLAAPAESPQPGPPVLVFFHGLGGSGAEFLLYETFRDAVLEAGFLLVAPNGLENPSLGYTDWALRDRPAWRDEAAFLAAVLDDVAARRPIDRDRILISGFSRGGMLSWELACALGARYRAYAPVAGAPPAPMPNDCAGGAAPVFHMHGLADVQVPLEGGPTPTGGAQGDVFAALARQRGLNQCEGGAPDQIAGDPGGLICRGWARCDMLLCLHPGAHALPPYWPAIALDWFSKLDER